MHDLPPARGHAASSAQPTLLQEAPTFRIGATISHYRIVDRLGHGGMGVVYRAEDTRLSRSVALKFLPPGVARHPLAKERFLQEARAASALDHPNICTIYEIDETPDGQLFLAMACYEGETLRAAIDRGPLALDRVLDVVRQIADGLDASHQSGIVHRDVKPANVWLTRSGQVKILDFGLAKVQGEGDLTRTGMSMGTPAYMSPEHVAGEKVGPVTDLWSLGVLVYEALTARLPFAGESVPEVIYAILTREPPSLAASRHDVPPELERIVARLLRKRPEERYASCRELQAELERFALSWLAVTSPALLAEEPAEAALAAAPPPPASPPPAPPPPASPPTAAPPPDGEGFDAHLARGLEAALARDYGRAVLAFERALELRPDDSRARFNLDRVRARMG